jgi:hypothetical protein
MATPTDQQQIRRHAAAAREEGGSEGHAAAWLALSNAVQVLGAPVVRQAIVQLGVRASGEDGPLPPLLGAAEAADVLGMKATNLKRLSPPLPVARAVISGRIPVYRESDVMAAKERRDARRAAA